MSDEQLDIFRAYAADAAYAQLLEGGIKNLSMRKLSRRLDCSTQKLYSNFKNKDELLLAIATHLRERIKKSDLLVKQCSDPLRYLLDLTFNTLQFFVSEPIALEILIEQRYRLEALSLENSDDPYCIALRALNCPELSKIKAFDDALSAIRLLIVGATHCLYGASESQQHKIFASTEYALCSMLEGWGLKR